MKKVQNHAYVRIYLKNLKKQNHTLNSIQLKLISSDVVE